MFLRAKHVSGYRASDGQAEWRCFALLINPFKDTDEVWLGVNILGPVLNSADGALTGGSCSQSSMTSIGSSEVLRRQAILAIPIPCYKLALGYCSFSNDREC